MKRFLQLSLLFSLLALCAAKAYLYYYEKTYSDEEIDRWFEPITSRYNVKIVYKINDDFFSPLEKPTSSRRTGVGKQGFTHSAYRIVELPQNIEKGIR